jgi:hypothetical protein
MATPLSKGCLLHPQPKNEPCCGDLMWSLIWNLKKQNDVGVREKYKVKIINRFAVLEKHTYILFT